MLLLIATPVIRNYGGITRWVPRWVMVLDANEMVDSKSSIRQSIKSACNDYWEYNAPRVSCFACARNHLPPVLRVPRKIQIFIRRNRALRNAGGSFGCTLNTEWFPGESLYGAIKPRAELLRSRVGVSNILW